MNKKLLYFFASALAIAGCVKEPQAVDSVSPDVQNANFSLMASSDVLSKTAVSNGNEIVWKAGDALSVWESGSASNVNVKLTLDESTAMTQSGLFKGTLTPAEEFDLYAIYPYNAEYGNDPAALSLTVPTAVNQATDLNSLVGVSDFMLGKASSKEYDSENDAYKMLFMHPLAFVQFYIDGSDCVYQQATLKTLTMTADVAFAGPVTVNLEDGTVVSAAEGTEGKTLVVNFPETAKMNAPQTAWVAINPVDLSDANCQFVLEMTNGQKVTFKVNPSEMQAQSLYKFEFKDIDTKIATGKGTPTYVDLVAMNGGERANCYIVKEGGYYRFAAQRVDKSNVFSGSKPNSDGYKADWLWATGTETRVDGVGIGNSGNINFRVKPNSDGNTIIALYSPEGEILWSWHIWCSTMEELMTPHHYSRNDSWMVSDINLGATSKADNDVNSYGLYYQWGRKDPFPADPSKCVMNEGVQMQGLSSKDKSVTANAVDYAVAHPTTFLSQNDYRTWISSENEATNAQTLWYTSTANRNGKTIYDPCPPGYLVPVQDSDYTWRVTNFKNENITVNATGITYTYDGISTFYPAAGYIKDLTNGVQDGGKVVRNWAANLSGTPTATSNMLGYSLMYTLSSSTYKREASRTGFGLPVRCMKK